MNSSILPAAIVAMAILPLPAALLAQSSTTSPNASTSTYVEIEDDTMIVGPFNLSVDELDDFDVIGSTGEKIGEIEDVLADESGVPVAVVIETEGFLGIGEDDVVVPLDRLTLVDAALQIDMTEEELEALPEWDD